MDGKPKDGKDVADAKANPVHMDDVLIEIGGQITPYRSSARTLPEHPLETNAPSM